MQVRKSSFALVCATAAHKKCVMIYVQYTMKITLKTRIISALLKGWVPKYTPNISASPFDCLSPCLALSLSLSLSLLTLPYVVAGERYNPSPSPLHFKPVFNSLKPPAAVLVPLWTRQTVKRSWLLIIHQPLHVSIHVHRSARPLLHARATQG